MPVRLDCVCIGLLRRRDEAKLWTASAGTRRQRPMCTEGSCPLCSSSYTLDRPMPRAAAASTGVSRILSTTLSSALFTVGGARPTRGGALPLTLGKCANQSRCDSSASHSCSGKADDDAGKGLEGEAQGLARFT